MHRVTRDEVKLSSMVAVKAERRVHTIDVAPHRHAFVELAVVVGGCATHVTTHGIHRITRGSLIVVHPGDWHAYEACQNLSLVDVYVGPELLRSELGWVADDPWLGVVLRPSARSRRALLSGSTRATPAALTRIRDACLELRREVEPGALDHSFRVAQLTLVLGQFAASLHDSSAYGTEAVATHPSVRRAAQLLEEQMAVDWNVPMLARAVNLAPGYLVRLCGQHLGFPPMTYLNRIRAERASAMLIETDLPVSTIGEIVGWTDPAYLSRRFRSTFSMSPTEYRQSFRRTADETDVTHVQEEVSQDLTALRRCD